MLLAGLLIVWLNPLVPAQVRDADQRIASLDARLRQLEARPIPAPQSLSADVAALAARVAALESRQNADPAQVAQRLDVMGGRIEGLASRLQAAQDGEKPAIDALTARVQTLEGAENSAIATAAKASQTARLLDAALALADGRPLGEIANAPPALTRFAKTAPPTEAQLRLSFPAAQGAALAAEQPDMAGKPFWDRVLAKAEALVTIKIGQDVVLGNNAAAVLAAAQAALDAGDLAQAVATLAPLTGAPKQAMAAWLSNAQALLAARSALASLAGQS